MRRRAFTFLELMFVVVILGVLLAVTIPRMGGMRQRMALTTSARDIVSSASLARALSASKQAETRLVFDPSGGSWRIDAHVEDESERRHRRRNRSDDLKTSDEAPRSLPARTTFKGFANDQGPIEPGKKDEVFVSFFPGGDSSGLTVEVQSAGGKVATIEIDKTGGQARVYMGPAKTIAARLRDAGLDPGEFPGLPDDSLASAGSASVPGEGFRHIGRSEEETVGAYSDVASRIFARTRKRVEAEQGSGMSVVESEALIRATREEAPAEPAGPPPTESIDTTGGQTDGEE